MVQELMDTVAHSGFCYNLKFEELETGNNKTIQVLNFM